MVGKADRIYGCVFGLRCMCVGVLGGMTTEDHDGTMAENWASTTAEDQNGKMAENWAGTTAEDQDGKMAENLDGMMAENQDGKMAENQDGKMAENLDSKIAENLNGMMVENQDGMMAEEVDNLDGRCAEILDPMVFASEKVDAVQMLLGLGEMTLRRSRCSLRGNRLARRHC